jgi:hypothetical protein
MRGVLDYWLANGADVDFLDFHKYDSSYIGQYTDSELFSFAETRAFETSTSFYGISDARQKWFNTRGTWLPVVDSENNMNSAWTNGSDPKIQQMVGTVWTALVLRSSVLKGVTYGVYYRFSSSKTYESANPSGGYGFGMINSDNGNPWYPYYLQEMVGTSLSVGDDIIKTNTSSVNVKPLAWVHGTTLNLMLINKFNQNTAVYIQGLRGVMNYSRIDNAISWLTPAVQKGFLDTSGTLTLDGYTVILLQQELANSTPDIKFAEGFESGNFSSWDRVFTTDGETASVQNTIAREDSHGAVFASNGGSSFEYAYAYKTVDPASEVYAQGYFYISSLGIANDGDHLSFVTIRAGSDSVAYAGLWQVKGLILWNLIVRDGANYVESCGSANPYFSPLPNQWYGVELRWYLDANEGFGELYVDGLLFTRITGVDTSAFGAADGVRFGLAELYNSDDTKVYVDHAVIAGSSLDFLPVTHPWDLNGDGRIDMRDILVLTTSFLTTPESPKWNPALDQNRDNIIDMRDLSIVLLHFGEV